MFLPRATREETPDLIDNIQDIIRATLVELNTCMPGVIVRYDADTSRCDVSPGFARKFIDPSLGDTSDGVTFRADITDVPIMFPRGKDGGITFPIAPGDPVLLVFSQRALDDWKDVGGAAVPPSARLHNITDAIAIPGLFSLPDAVSAKTPPSDKTAVYGDKVFVGDPDETLTPVAPVAPVVQTVLPGPAAPTPPPSGEAVDLVNVLLRFMTLMKNANYGGLAMTGGGGMDAGTAAEVTQLTTDLEKLQ
jgi:hypothetical protein